MFLPYYAGDKWRRSQDLFVLSRMSRHAIRTNVPYPLMRDTDPVRLPNKRHIPFVAAHEKPERPHTLPVIAFTIQLIIGYTCGSKW